MSECNPCTYLSIYKTHTLFTYDPNKTFTVYDICLSVYTAIYYVCIVRMYYVL